MKYIIGANALPNEHTIQVAGNLERFEGTRDKKSLIPTKEPENSRSNVFEAFRFLLGRVGRGMKVTLWFLRLRLRGDPGPRLEPPTRFVDDLLESFSQRF
jgi:hypothetical protein